VITHKTFDVAVVGAGVFGAWSALQLRRAGAEVILLDAYGAGNSRASSGGESRVMRMGYGPDLIYTRMAQRSLELWRKLFDSIEEWNAGGGRQEAELLQPTGVLWLAREKDPYCEATVKALDACDVKYERLDRAELRRRYPQIELGSASSAAHNSAAAPQRWGEDGQNGGEISWGFLEPKSGVLMARRAVQAVVAEARALGVTYLEDAVVPFYEGGSPTVREGAGVLRTIDNNNNSRVSAPSLTVGLPPSRSPLRLTSGREIFARQFVFACGPWLPKMFPELLGELIHVTRQEVFFFGVPAGDERFGPERCPVWIDLGELVYGIPNLDGRGFKVAVDKHGPQFDPDTGDRIVSPESAAAIRAYLDRRFPALANSPVTETRVCQYENTSNGDFLIDRHPTFENVWLVGGGSGHGFKHGPAVGEHVAALVSGDASAEPRFSLESKRKS
jgi:glycine/D-amino acid oxidase-like deaminating enzyme